LCSQLIILYFSFNVDRQVKRMTNYYNSTYKNNSKISKALKDSLTM
jgi:hypothetical protein